MRRANGFAAALLLVFCLVFPSGARGAPGAAGAQLVASGCSVSNTGYLTDLAADYQKLTGVKVYVRGGGSVVGLEDLVSGSSDFAASCRGRLPGDPAEIEFIQVAWDALVFIVHPSNPLETISFASAASIFRGAVRDWGQVKGPPGPITVFLQRPTKGLSGVESSIRSQVLAGGAPAEGPNVSELASTGIVEQLVEKTRSGFAASGYSSARKRAVKMLALDGVKPTREAIIERTYPLRRPLYLIAKRPLRPEVKGFVDFALGRQGQELIESYGVIPMREMR